MRLVVTIRPEPGASATKAAGEAIGLTMLAAPMWEVRPLAWTAPDPASVAGLLIGSANALRHAGPELARLAALPVHAVGQATAALARRMGHEVASIGEGGLQKVIDALPPAPVRLLRLAGAEHMMLSLPPHVTLETRIVYDTLPLAMAEELAATLRQGALVLLHSAISAQHFAAECDRLGLDRAAIAIAALGPRIAAAAGTGWADIRSASAPNDPSLLALAAQMCH